MNLMSIWCEIRFIFTRGMLRVDTDVSTWKAKQATMNKKTRVHNSHAHNMLQLWRTFA